MDTSEEITVKLNPVSKKKTVKDHLWYIKDNVTVEPALFCYFMPAILTKIAIQNLYIDKACRVNFKFGDAVCDSLLARDSNETLQEEIAVQKLISSMEVWKNFVATVIPTFMILFLGAWSDRTGKRKTCIIMPVVGDLLTCLSMIVSVYFFYEIPLAVLMFLEAIFPAITGGYITVFMGAYSYISDVSSEESRTFRIGMANLCVMAGIPMGSALSGVLLNRLGYYGAFGFSAIFKIFCIWYGCYYIPNPKRPNKATKTQPSGVFSFLKSFFDIKCIKNTFVVAFKKGPNKRRTKSILILFSIFIVHGLEEGEYVIRYYFTRYRFNWDVLNFSAYNTVHICAYCVGTVISVGLLSRYLKWHDSLLGIISCCCKIIGAIVVSQARTSLVMYLSVVIESFNSASFATLRSLSSKLVPSDELGQMTSIFNLTEMLATMVFKPLYSWIYKETIAIDASVVFYFGASLTLMPLTIFIWFFLQHKKSVRRSRRNDNAAGERFLNPGTNAEPKNTMNYLLGMEMDKIEIH